MNKNNVRPSRLVQFLAACAFAGSAASSFAATTYFDLGAGCASTQTTSSISCGTTGGVSVTAQAYSTNTAAGTTFAAATIANWGAGSGLGVYGASDSGSPNHATDNANGTDLIALNFGTAVNLSSITLGWWAYDADITVMAYTGAGVPTITGKGLTSFTAANGWASVKNYGTATASATNTGGTDTDKSYTTTDTTTYSSWWLISAYNSNFTGGSALDAINDYVKVLAVAGTTKPVTPPGKVPEPGTLALMGAAFFGIIGARRRTNATKATKAPMALAA